MSDSPSLTAAEPRVIRVLIVEDHVLVRQAIKAIVRSDPTLENIGEADSTLSALEAVSLKQPDVVTVDVRLRDSSGIDLTRAIKRYHPQVKVLALTAHTQHHYFRAMSRAGADGYLFKHASSAELLKAIHGVYAGRPVLPGAGLPDQFSPLTGREREVLQMVGERFSAEQIAERLGLSTRTVSSRVGDIKSKLRAESSMAAVTTAAKLGLISTATSR